MIHKKRAFHARMRPETLALRAQLAINRRIPTSTLPLVPLFGLNGSANSTGNGNGAGFLNDGHDDLPNGSATGPQRLRFVILGRSITSSWGNGHATTYRSLVRELTRQGHEVLFLERDAEWSASNRDLPSPPYGRVALYTDLRQLRSRWAREVRNADVVMVGSCVPEGTAIGQWVTRIAHGVTVFYDIDTPVTVANLARGDLDYLTAALIPRYQLYLSFTGGPILHLLEDHYGSPMARPLYCSVDPTLYYPEQCEKKWDMGYMGTYSEDRQPALDELLLQPARHWSTGRFVVAGSQYPKQFRWPRNVRRYAHLAPGKHRAFYNSQRLTLNVTRAEMVEAGYAPSVRLFEAAACGTPIISDWWEGLDQFFTPNREILISRSSEESLYYLLAMDESERVAVGQRARKRVLASHTARHRAEELTGYILDIMKPSRAAATLVPSL